MKLLLTLLPFYAAVMLLIQLIPVRINLFFVRENKDDFMTIRINTFYSLIRFNIEVPLIRQESPFDMTLEAELKAGEDELVREKKETFSFLNINWDKVRQHIHWIQKNKKTLWFIARFYARAMRIEKLVIRVRTGLEDAAQTGLIAGMLWTLLSTGTSVMQKYVRFSSEPFITIHPDFNHQPVFAAKVDTVLSFRIGHFTIGGLLFLSTKIRGGRN